MVQAVSLFALFGPPFGKCSLVPRPPPFYLPFAFTIIHRSRNQKKKPGSIHHVSGREVDIKGEGPIFK